MKNLTQSKLAAYLNSQHVCLTHKQLSSDREVDKLNNHSFCTITASQVSELSYT